MQTAAHDTDHRGARCGKTLVFSVALNGYQWRYGRLLKSHKQYAQAHGYHYVAVTKPSFSLLGLEVAWLKISLIIEALKSSYETILFLDADTQVSTRAPCLSGILDAEDSQDKSIFAAKGFSGRFNSGVLLVRNTKASQYFFKSLLAIALSNIPQEDQVGWGENGHLIYLAKQCPAFAELDSRWNNNHTPELSDFIRHYSRGPLHHEYQPSIGARLLSLVSRSGIAIGRRLCRLNRYFLSRSEAGKSRHTNFYEQLARLANKVCIAYPAFKR